MYAPIPMLRAALQKSTVLRDLSPSPVFFEALSATPSCWMLDNPRRFEYQDSATVDTLGNTLRILLTPGQASEYEQAAALIVGFTCEAVRAHKGYDSVSFVDAIQCMGAGAVIPSKTNRLHPRTLGRHLYKARSLIEHFFLKLKQFRRIATRYERLARNY